MSVQIIQNKIHRILFYAGFDEKKYDGVKSKVCHANRTVVALISSCATVLILAMYISTFFVPGVKSNRTVYSIGVIMSLIVAILALTSARKHEWLTMPLVYAACFIFYVYGILIGTITDPGQKTVTFIAMLVFLPVLFIDRPIHSIASTAGYIAIFVYLCFKTKTGAVLQNDVIDAIVFGILGLISGTIINRIKVHGYILEDKLQEISRIDQLTQMNNRNSYELKLELIPELSNHSLACIYIDVNGLHELNNEKGHAIGDEMLKFIAEQIKIYFGNELTYRIGGDEFVAFAPDISQRELEQNLQDMISSIEAEGYHVATGYEIMKTRYLIIGNLIKSAESKMYQDKKQFYKNRAYDRRRS